MAIEKTDGILLRRRSLRESSLILTFYTKDFGKMSGVIKGARGPRAQLGINPQLFSLNRIIFYESKRKRLSIISQCDLLDLFRLIRRDLQKSVYAEYFLELVDLLTAEFDRNSALFELLFDSLKLMCTPASTKRIARIFEIRLMNLIGLMPELAACADCGTREQRDYKFSFRSGGLLCQKCSGQDNKAVGISKGTINFIEYVKNSSYERASKIKVSKNVGMELELIMRRFVDYHVPDQLKTIAFMRKTGI